MKALSMIKVSLLAACLSMPVLGFSKNLELMADQQPVGPVTQGSVVAGAEASDAVTMKKMMVTYPAVATMPSSSGSNTENMEVPASPSPLRLFD